MPSIMPDTSSGGVIVRSSAGAPVVPPGASTPNVYRPAPGFVMTCPQTATPSNTCPPPPSPAQMNAIYGELLSFAEALSPTGPWDCSAVGNLGALFSAWAASFAGADVHLSGLQSYNTTTNVMTFAMSDGSTVDVDMTTLIADALASFAPARFMADPVAP